MNTLGEALRDYIDLRRGLGFKRWARRHGCYPGSFASWMNARRRTLPPVLH